MPGTSARWRSIVVASKRLGRVREWIAERSLSFIGEPEFVALGRDLEIPEAALRKLLRDTGVALHPMVEGVRQDSFENLGRTLTDLQRQYELAGCEQARRIRRLVITAKEHAKFAARSKPEKREMVEWLLVWLENPPVFETWLKLRLGTHHHSTAISST
jgi:hypothetical protein